MSDAGRIYLLRGLRSFAFGFGSVLLAVTLRHAGLSGLRVGAILTSTLAGAAAVSALIGFRGDRIGRRRTLVALGLAMTVTGVVFASTTWFPALFLAALTGSIAVQVIEAGPLLAVEQAMIAEASESGRRTRAFGRYNIVAALSGSAGALAAGGPDLLRRVIPRLPADQRFFLLYATVGLTTAFLAARLSDRVEARGSPRPLTVRSRRVVGGLSALFALDAFAGGFVVQSFIAYWFLLKFHPSPILLGSIFAGVGVLQSLSFLVSVRLAERIGLVNTMVFTHLPSNLLLAAIPLAPNLGTAAALLLARFALSQMDVPARQSYVVAVVDPEERTAAAAFTTTARAVATTASPVLGGASVGAALGLPFFLGGGLKIVYDLLLYAWFRRLKAPEELEHAGER
jgi:MFS family permease